jgi:hypothetical protein
MTEEDIFIELRISHYRAMLELKLCAVDRTNITRLLTESERMLEVTVEHGEIGVVRPSITFLDGADRRLPDTDVNEGWFVAAQRPAVDASAPREPPQASLCPYSDQCDGGNLCVLCVA